MKQAKVELQEVERGEMALTFAYADDRGLITGQPAQLQATLDIWTKVLTDNGLKLKVKNWRSWEWGGSLRRCI